MTVNTEEYLAPEDLELQEHLTLERLKALDPVFKIDTNEVRPPANFIDLMNWAEKQFKSALKDKTNLQKFVHNRIIIDGQFLQFCESHNVIVECLYKDSIISWVT